MSPLAAAQSSSYSPGRQLNLPVTHLNYFCLPRLVQVLKNSLLFVSSDFNKVVLIVHSEVPLLDDLLQGSCILLHPKDCSKSSVEDDISLGSLSSLRKTEEKSQMIMPAVILFFISSFHPDHNSSPQ